MRISRMTAAALAATALAAACDDAPPEDPDIGGVQSGEDASGGTGLAETETPTGTVDDLDANPPPPEGVARDPEATAGKAGPNRPEGVERTDHEGDGRNEDVLTGSAEMETEDPNGMRVDFDDPSAAQSPQEKTEGDPWGEDG